MSLNFTKSGNVLEKIVPVKNNSPRIKKPVNRYYACRKNLRLGKKRVLVTGKEEAVP